MKNFRMVLMLALLLSVPYVCGSADYKLLPGGVRYEHIGDYSVERLNQIMTSELKNFSDFKITYPPATNDVSLYRVIYTTSIPEQGNRQVEASGLVAVPKLSPRRMPIVSYQHGTVFSRTEAPSNPEETYETRLMVARFAGRGYIVVAADYIGKGISEEPDSYMVKGSTAQACLDMLYASKTVCDDLNVKQGDLFLSGWSQGSWNTGIFRKQLESLGIPVRAAATAATPNDIYLMMTSYVNNHQALDAAWLVGIYAIILNSYESYYDMPFLTNIAIRPEYWQTARDFYDNNIGWADASKIFPSTVAELLEPAFAEKSSMLADRFYRLLQANDAYRWRYLTPSRYYYGKIDEAIRPYVATLPAAYEATIGGAPTKAICAGADADHRGTFLFSVLHEKNWFDWLITQ